MLKKGGAGIIIGIIIGILIVAGIVSYFVFKGNGGLSKDYCRDLNLRIIDVSIEGKRLPGYDEWASGDDNVFYEFNPDALEGLNAREELLTIDFFINEKESLFEVLNSIQNNKLAHKFHFEELSKGDEIKISLSIEKISGGDDMRTRKSKLIQKCWSEPYIVK